MAHTAWHILSLQVFTLTQFHTLTLLQQQRTKTLAFLGGLILSNEGGIFTRSHTNSAVFPGGQGGPSNARYRW